MIGPEQEQVIGIISPPRDDTWPLSRLHVDPTNSEIFDPLPAPELTELAKSIKEVVIHPLSVLSDGLIIAGEQRYRAALEAGLTMIPVRIYENLTTDQITLFRIAENCARRHLKPSETRRAILATAQITGKKSPTGLNRTGTIKTRGKGGLLRGKLPTIKALTGLSASTIEHHINHEFGLIEGLKTLLDEGLITVNLANKLVTIDTEIQKAVLENFHTILNNKDLSLKEQQQKITELTTKAQDYQNQQETLEARVTALTEDKQTLQTQYQEQIKNLRTEQVGKLKKIRGDLATAKRQLKEMKKNPDELHEEITARERHIEELQKQKDETDRQILEVKRQKETELKKKQKELDAIKERKESLENFIKHAADITRSNKVDKFIKMGAQIIAGIDPKAVVYQHHGRFGADMLLSSHIRSIEYIIPWLQYYSDEIKKAITVIELPEEPLAGGEVVPFATAKAAKKREEKKQ